MPDVREATTQVDPYNYRRDGERVHVPGHPAHYQTGTPVYVVLFRPKEQHGRTGTRPAYKWRIKGRFRSESRANRERRRLMRQGYHSIVEEIGGRSRMPSLHELVNDARRADIPGE
jgi:hypothetical protein